jgi:hypothetical protein
VHGAVEGRGEEGLWGRHRLGFDLRAPEGRYILGLGDAEGGEVRVSPCGGGVAIKRGVVALKTDY